jgi:hypothetical protein
VAERLDAERLDAGRRVLPASRISDADLMRANAAVTREVRGLLAPTPTPTGDRRLLDRDEASGDDFRGLLAAASGALTDPDRRLPDGRRLDQFAPCAPPRPQAHLHARSPHPPGPIATEPVRYGLFVASEDRLDLYAHALHLQERLLLAS